MIRNFAHPDRNSIIKLLHRHGDAIGGCIVGFWHKPADPECPLSRRVLEGKRTCHGIAETTFVTPSGLREHSLDLPIDP
jgi:hypothetical protein